jgi:hypothetical protein
MYADQDQKRDGHGFLLVTLMLIMAGVTAALYLVQDPGVSAHSRVYVTSSAATDHAG